MEHQPYINKKAENNPEYARQAAAFYENFLDYFASVYVVNLTDRTYLTFHGEQYLENGYAEIKDYVLSIGKYIEDSIHPDDQIKIREAVDPDNIRKRLQAEKRYQVEIRETIPGLPLRWLKLEVSRGADEEHACLAFTDITETVAHEKTTNALIGALSSVYAYGYVVSMIRKTSAPVRLGRRLSELKGENYASEHPFNLKLYADENVYPEDRPLFEPIETVEKCRKLFEDRDRYTVPYRLLLGGELHYMELELVKSTESEDEFFMGFKVVDEQEKTKQEQRRKEHEQLGIIQALSSEYVDMFLINAKTDRFRIIRADGVGLDVTKEQENAGAALCRYIDKYVVPEDRDTMYEMSTVAAMGEKVPETGVYTINYRRISGDGYRNFQQSTAKFKADDGTDYFIHAYRDITPMVEEQVRVQKALREAYDAADAASHAKSDFLQTMSHDIRTPMNGIIGMTAIAAAHIDDKERVKDSLQKITAASKHLLSLINEVLDMSKIESGKVILTEEDFNLSDLIDNMVTMIQPQVRAHGHDLIINIQDVKHERVIGDSLRVQQVFMNMMGNAIKYTPDGGKLRLSIREIPCRQFKTGCYEFTFADNGIGMSEDYIAHIFEPFTRAEDGRVSKIQGTGLGMPIAKNIVNMMGGDIKVQSKLGEGSTFIVTIYLKLQDQTETDYEKFIDLSVLVADDDELCMESAVEMLEELGMKADGVLSGQEAVDRVTGHHAENKDYHAVILDWKMPGMDGVETARAIRREVGGDIPIIVLSSYDWTEIEAEARNAGVNFFVSKPLFKSRLVRLFNEVLGAGQEKADSYNPLQPLEEMNLEGYRCLLVEDNDLNAEIAAEILEETGIQVDRASDGAEAVDIMLQAADGAYDLILMDIQMPKMNGNDATRAIRAMNRDYCKKVPIIAMTANAFAEDVQAAKTAGMNEHIAKPIDLNALARIISKYVLRDSREIPV